MPQELTNEEIDAQVTKCQLPDSASSGPPEACQLHASFRGSYACHLAPTQLAAYPSRCAVIASVPAKLLVWELICPLSILVMLQIEVASASPTGQDYAVQSLRAPLDQVPRHICPPAGLMAVGQEFPASCKSLRQWMHPSSTATYRSPPHMRHANPRANAQVDSEEFEADLVQFLEATGERRLAKNVRGKHVGWCVPQLPPLV